MECRHWIYNFPMLKLTHSECISKCLHERSDMLMLVSHLGEECYEATKIFYYSLTNNHITVSSGICLANANIQLYSIMTEEETSVGGVMHPIHPDTNGHWLLAITRHTHILRDTEYCCGCH